MATNAIDKEQIEMLKEWWNDYGKAIAFAVVIGLIIGFGWRYHHQRQIAVAQQASMMYSQLQNAAMAHDSGMVNQISTALMKQYGSTPYASMGALISARMFVEKADLNSALKQCQWAMREGSNNLFKQIARINAARILLAQQKTDDALKTLATVDDSALLPMVESTRGDVYKSENKMDLAQKSYISAQAGFNSANVPAPLLQLLIAQS